jgi:LysM repeat protein
LSLISEIDKEYSSSSGRRTYCLFSFDTWGMKTFGIITKIYLFYLQHSDKINEMAQAASDKSNLNWVRIVISYVQKRAWQRATGTVDEFGKTLNTAAPVIYNGEVPLLNSPPAPPDTFACQVHPGFKRQDNTSASCILPSGVTVEPPVASIFASLSSLSAAESVSSAAIAASIASVESVSSVQASLSALSVAESASILSAESVSSVQASLNALSAVVSRLSALSLSIASAESVSSALSPAITPIPPCTQDYVVVGGDTCYLIWTKFGITEAQLYSWNPTLNANCNITISQVLCVAEPTTTSTSSVFTPPITPTPQPTITPNPPCTQDYVVVGGDTCYSIWTKFGITEADLYSWNILWLNCSLTIGQVLCVACGPDPATISLPIAPSTSENNPTTPTDVQSIVSITPTGPVITGNPTNLPALPKLSTTDTMCPSPFGSTVIYKPKTGTGPCPTYPTPAPPAPTTQSTPEQPPSTSLPQPSSPNMSSPACIACTNDLGASSCGPEDSNCLFKQCVKDINCQTCGILCLNYGP